MLLLLIPIISLAIIFIYMRKREREIEGFQVSPSDEYEKTKSISQILSDISLDTSKYNTNSEIDFKDLEIDLKKFNNEDLESIISQLPYETIPKTEVNYDIENQDLRAYNVSQNELAGIKVTRDKYESTLKMIEEEKRQLLKAKLLRELIIKKKLEKKQALDLSFQQKKIKRLEDYSKNKINSLNDKCPIEPLPFNALQRPFNPLVNLDFTKHPVKWYGMETRLKNKLASNFSYF